MFLELNTCWRIDGTAGIYLGLDYPSIEVVMNMHNVVERSELFRSVQIMERAAMSVLNKKEKDNG